MLNTGQSVGLGILTSPSISNDLIIMPVLGRLEMERIMVLHHPVAQYSSSDVLHTEMVLAEQHEEEGNCYETVEGIYQDLLDFLSSCLRVCI